MYSGVSVGAGSGLRSQGRMMSLHSELRAQLGVAVPAMALPEDTSEDAEPVLLFFGIVDFLQVAAPFLQAPCVSCCNVFTGLISAVGHIR